MSFDAHVRNTHVRLHAHGGLCFVERLDQNEACFGAQLLLAIATTQFFAARVQRMHAALCSSARHFDELC